MSNQTILFNKRVILIGAVSMFLLVLILNFPGMASLPPIPFNMLGANFSSNAATQTKWRGLSSEWKNATNWDNGIPGPATDVIISVGSATGKVDPVVPSPTGGDSAMVNNLNVQSGGNLRFAAAGGLLVVNGNERLQNDGAITLGNGIIIFKNKITFMNGGTFNAGSGTLQFEGVTWDNKSGATFEAGTSTVIFDGDSNQSITGGISFYNLQVYTTGTLSITGSVTVLNDANVSSTSSVSLGSGDSLVVEGTLQNDGTVSGGTVTAAVTLPVQLQAFTATGNALGASLQWHTATETENAGFQIERRQTVPLSASWISIAFVPGAGTSSAPRQYSYEDRDLAAGTYAYRIKQIDRDGSFRYYGTAEIVVGTVPKELSLAQNYPNPFNPSTEIVFSVPSDGNASLSVYDVTGKEVARLFDGPAQSGQFLRATFDGSRLSTGIYFSVLRYDTRVVSRKMLLAK